MSAGEVVLAHGDGVAAYDELIIVGVLLLVLVLAVLQVRWKARHSAPRQQPEG